MSRPAQVVVTRVSALGDVVLATPVLEALRARRPDARLTLVTSAGLAGLFEGHPALDAVVAWEDDADGRHAPVREVARAVLAHGPVELHVDLQNKLRTWRLGRALGARRRVALRKRSALATLAALFGRDPPLTGRHATRLYFDALSAEGIPEPQGDGPLPTTLSLSSDLLEAARIRLAALPPGPRVGIAPGARWPTKRWPAARFAALADRLRADGAVVVSVGGSVDGPTLESFHAALAPPPELRTDALSLPEMAAVLAGLDLLVVGDSGPGHLAAALGVPVVSVFGPTDPARWRPSGGEVRVAEVALDCRPCTNHGGARCPVRHHHCLETLEVDAVHALARTLLARPAETVA